MLIGASIVPIQGMKPASFMLQEGKGRQEKTVLKAKAKKRPGKSRMP